MPPGHANAIFVQDANKFKVDDVMDAFREAKRQNAFVFWNHPHWTAQAPNGIVPLDQMHLDLFEEGLIQGVEVYNEYTYSDEALKLALDHNLTIMGNSDVHGLVDWVFSVPQGGHRPVTLVFAKEKSAEAIKEALFAKRTAVWFDNTLVGDAEAVHIPTDGGNIIRWTSCIIRLQIRIVIRHRLAADSRGHQGRGIARPGTGAQNHNHQKNKETSALHHILLVEIIF